MAETIKIAPIMEVKGPTTERLEPRKKQLPLSGLVEEERFVTEAIALLKKYLLLQKYGRDKRITIKQLRAILDENLILEKTRKIIELVIRKAEEQNSVL